MSGVAKFLPLILAGVTGALLVLSESIPLTQIISLATPWYFYSYSVLGIEGRADCFIDAKCSDNEGRFAGNIGRDSSARSVYDGALATAVILIASNTRLLDCFV